MNRLLKNVWVVSAVGMVFVPSLFILFDLRSHSKRPKNLVLSTTKSTEFHRLKPTTIQNLLEEEFSNHLPEKDSKENLEAIEISIPLYGSSYDSCLNIRSDKSENLNFHELPTGNVIYSAFLDFRFKEEAFIRLVSILPAYGKVTQMYCHFMDLKTYEFFSSIVEVEELGENHGYAYQGFISSCDLPEQIDSYTLCSVNISTAPEADQQTVNNTRLIPLHVIDRRVNTKTYSLCVPPISGDISSERLVEFIELSQILGVSHFTFYNSKATNKTLEILRYYKGRGLVSILPWKLPQFIASNIQDYGQTTALNDCLYRNMERFDYTAFNGLDEFIVPLQDKAAPHIFQSFNDEDAAGYCFQNFIFYTKKTTINDSGTRLVTQRFTSRAKFPTNQLSRCIAKLGKVFSLDFNAITNPVESYYTALDLEPSLGYVFHYDEGECNDGQEDCADSYQDSTILKYRDELETRFNETMNNLRRSGFA